MAYSASDDAGSDEKLDAYTAVDTRSGSPVGARIAATAAHAGTVVAYRMPLADAVKQGIATLSAKGDTFGDVVQIDADNSSSVTTDDLRLHLYLELWGSGASNEIAAVIENAIETAWSGTTSDGKTFKVDVITRLSPGGLSAPGTPGFHQIKLVPDSTIKSDVHDNGEPFGPNQGTGGGTWASTGSDLEKLYAHEAGHLFGIDDRYNEYLKQPDGTWKRTSDGATFTDEELADEIAPQHPEYAKAEVLERIKKPGRERITSPQPGFQNDLMGNLNGEVSQSDIDALAALAGLLIDVDPGDAFLNKWGSRQNMAVIRDEDVFVPSGEMTTLEGLFAACIDRASGIPQAGDLFDFAPPIADWAGIEAASYVVTLLEYLNARDRFCPADRFALSVLWRLTNNAGMSDPNIAAYLAEAGIDVGFRDLDFPRLSNPNLLGLTSGFVTPEELFVPSIVSSVGEIAEVTESVSFTAELKRADLRHSHVGLLLDTRRSRREHGGARDQR